MQCLQRRCQHRGEGSFCPCRNEHPGPWQGIHAIPLSPCVDEFSNGSSGHSCTTHACLSQPTCCVMFFPLLSQYRVSTCHHRYRLGFLCACQDRDSRS